MNIERLKREFGKVYDDHVDKIYRFIYIKVNSKEVAEDLTADTFVQTWGLVKVYARHNEKVRNYNALLYGVARNLVTDYYRTKREGIVPLESVQLASSAGLEEKAMINSDLSLVMKGISQLKDDYQNVLIWYYLDELTVSEIADLLDKSENNTRVIIHRALSSLRKVLEV